MKLYSAQQIADEYGITVSSVRKRIKSRQIEPTKIENNHNFYYDEKAKYGIMNTAVNQKPKPKGIKIVRVVENYFFYHSKLNFLNLNQL